MKYEQEMGVFSIDLPRNIDELTLVAFSDFHIGDENVNMKFLKDQIKIVEENKDVYCVLNGDLINNATTTSVSNTYEQTMSPQKQKKLVVELLKPIKNKILFITSGNHENRTYRQTGIDIMEDISKDLGLEDRYFKDGGALIFRFGKVKYGKKETNGSGKTRQRCYTAYITHGGRGGSTKGGKANALGKLADTIVADLYILGHGHQLHGTKDDIFLIDVRNNTVQNITRGYMMSGSALGFGGYGQVKTYGPTTLGFANCVFQSKQKDFKTTV